MISLRLEPLVIEALNEASLGSGDILLGGDQESQELAKQMNRTDWICAALATMMSTKAELPESNFSFSNK